MFPIQQEASCIHVALVSLLVELIIFSEVGSCGQGDGFTTSIFVSSKQITTTIIGELLRDTQLEQGW